MTQPYCTMMQQALHRPLMSDVAITDGTITVADESVSLSAVSYNMHGFNQGSHTVRDLVLGIKPDIFLLQEHWLTPANLSKFEYSFPQYMCFGSSAMTTDVETGVLRGRPFGGVMTLVSRRLQTCSKIVCAEDRYVIVIVGNMLVINVYMPCVGTINRSFIYEEIINNLELWMHKYPNHTVVIGGDINSDLDNVNSISEIVNRFIVDNCLQRCDTLWGANTKRRTYYNESLNCESTIDYFLVSNNLTPAYYDVMDIDSNLSDHLPIIIECKCKPLLSDHRVLDLTDNDNLNQTTDTVIQLRWDHADLLSYSTLTGYYFQGILKDIIDIEKSTKVDPVVINGIYNDLVDSLRLSADVAVPACRKNFFKFWWDTELDDLKERSIASCRIWKAAGRPRSGPIFDIYRRDKSAYRNEIRLRQREEKQVYTNELHEALLKKQTTAFWKCWRSKFGENKRSVNYVSGINDPKIIAGHFASHFEKVCTRVSASGAARLKTEYEHARSVYCGLPFSNIYQFDSELVENVIAKLKRGKAPGLDNITCEHLQYSHALLPCILSKLFNLMMYIGHVPPNFGQSYTVPILKGSCNPYGKSVTVEDFRGISISPVMSKVLEHCILDRYGSFFKSSDNQFGFKKESSCAHAVFTLRCAINHYVSLGTTVNICALDLSKAFDKMNHHGLFLKLMEKHIPVNLLSLIENWFMMGVTCIKWGSVMSRCFRLFCGIRQGGVLSPYLFAVYIDSIVVKVLKSNIGCYVKWTCMSVLLYADDIILLAPSITALQQLLHVCEQELRWLDMSINVKKSACMRIGPRFNAKCNNIITVDGRELTWVDNIRYLGVYVTAARMFNCSIHNAKRSFYRAFNAIFGKVGRVASEDVVMELLKTKCLPILYYGLEACPLNKSQIHSLEFALNSCLRKLFNTRSQDIVDECMTMFNCLSVEDSLLKRKCKFMSKLGSCKNSLISVFADNAAEELSLSQ